jgi:hypothetical protein
MWALAVVVGRVDVEDVFEVAAAEDQQPVETLGSDGADEAFGVGVCLWRADRCSDDPDPFAAEDLVEGAAELAVAMCGSLRTLAPLLEERREQREMSSGLVEASALSALRARAECSGRRAPCVALPDRWWFSS